ncbi:MAG: T9SS type A sorting domain-containing protein [Bacteroidales bacterium]|nr:T9SS type A sorting domain-containing protein [Bacteroidales bacterium]
MLLLVDLLIRLFYPNPASTTANVIVNIDKPSLVELSLVNMLGQVVYSSSMNLSYAGMHQLRLDVSSYDSGIYFVKVQAGNDVVAKKLMID